MPSGSRPTWCVVATYANAEFRADHHLRVEQHFDTYLPTVIVRRRHRFIPSRSTDVLAALFPSYLFLRFDPRRPWRPIQNTPGVFKLITDADGYPSTCSNAVVEAVRSAVDAAEAFAAPSPAWKPGMPCSLAAGPLAGTPAIVTQVGKEMATVALVLFGHLREVAVQLDALQPRTD
jgi:transcription antitermination factor NusG